MPDNIMPDMRLPRLARTPLEAINHARTIRTFAPDYRFETTFKDVVLIKLDSNSCELRAITEEGPYSGIIYVVPIF